MSDGRNPPSGEFDADRSTVVDGDPAHRRIAADGAALPLDQPHHAGDQRAGPAHREMHAVFAFQEGDEAIDRGRAERIAADQERMEAQHLTQLLAAHVTRHFAIDRAKAFQPHQIGQDADHVGDGSERHMAEPLEPRAVGCLAHRHEGAVAREIARCEPRNFALHRVGVAGIVEGLAVLEADTIERRYRPQVDIVFEATAAQRP